jgi:hypothetical protein
MDQADLDAIEARLNASTPGRWRLDNGDDSSWWDGRAWIGPEERERRGIKVCRHWHVWGPRVPIGSSGNDAYYLPDMRFIAHAPEDMRALIAEVRALRKAAAAR